MRDCLRINKKEVYIYLEKVNLYSTIAKVHNHSPGGSEPGLQTRNT